MEAWARFLARGVEDTEKAVLEEEPPPLDWPTYLAKGVPGVNVPYPDVASAHAAAAATAAAAAAIQQKPVVPESVIPVVPVVETIRGSGSGIFANTKAPPPPSKVSNPVVPPIAPSSSSSSSSSSKMAGGGGNAKVIILWSSISTDSNTTRMEDMFAAKRLVHEKYDGSWPDYLELRNKLFSVSGHRGKYPQCFISRVSPAGNEEYQFIGMWEDVENLVESDSIPGEFLASHPEIKTFSKTFADVKRI